MLKKSQMPTFHKSNKIRHALLLLFMALSVGLCASSDYKLKILRVNTENFPDAAFVEFTVTDGSGNFVPNLQLSDFELWDNSAQMYGCRKLVQDLSEVKLPVDVLFLVDNSGSMTRPQANVNAAVPQFLDGLKDKGDIRAGLARLGHYEQYDICPKYATVEVSNSSVFQPLQTDTDVNEFKELWKRNKVDGSYEPYYEVLNWVAEQDLGYRQNALKTFILIGDEYVMNDGNNHRCDRHVSVLSQGEVADKLDRYGIQTFVIQYDSIFNEDFYMIAERTGGCFGDIKSTNYDGVLTQISNKIKGRYIMRYCIPPEQVEAYCDDEDRIVTVEYGKGGAKGSARYRNARTASIVRSKTTQMLDTNPVDPGVPVTVEIDVIGHGNEVDYVKMFYRNEENLEFNSITVKAADAAYTKGDTLHYVFEIPDDVVCEPYVRYYVEVYTHRLYNGIISYQNRVCSPPYHRDDFSWSIAVKPMQTPIITNVTSSPAYPCNRMYVVAEADGAGTTLTVKLHYRIADTPGEYRTVLMERSAGGAYMGVIPKTAFVDSDVEYYITATDESGLTGRHGTAESPIRVVSDQLSAGSRLSPMDIVFLSRNSVMIGCESLADGDTIAAYYESSCDEDRTEYLMSASRWDEKSGQMRLRVYGKSLDAMYKDGYAEGDSIVLRLIRGGRDYELRGHRLRYSSTVGEVIFDGVTMGVREPELDMAKELDFGECEMETVRNVIVKNTGCEDLLILKAEVGEGNFMISQNSDSIIVHAGEDTQIGVSYLPFDDSEAEMCLHVNTKAHKHCVKLIGKSTAHDACMRLKLLPEKPSEGIPLSLKLDAAEALEADISLRAVCSDTPLWMVSRLFDCGEHTLTVGEHLLPGQYKISIYTSEGLCERPFNVSR